MAAALDDIILGKVPKDRIALRCLYEEMATWPDVTDDTPPAAA